MWNKPQHSDSEAPSTTSNQTVGLTNDQYTIEDKARKNDKHQFRSFSLNSPKHGQSSTKNVFCSCQLSVTTEYDF